MGKVESGEDAGEESDECAEWVTTVSGMTIVEKQGSASRARKTVGSIKNPYFSFNWPIEIPAAPGAH